MNRLPREPAGNSKTFSKYEYASYKMRSEETREAIIARIKAAPLGLVVTMRRQEGKS